MGGLEGRNFAGSGAGTGSGSGGGVYRASDAMQQGDVSSNAFDDFFEYALTQPVTIHKNESAMVPILQQDLPTERVTLWSDKGNKPLRAVWLENTFQAHARCGQLFHLRERRVCRRGIARSYPSRRKAAALLRRRPGGESASRRFRETRTLHHVAMHEGVLVETTSEVTENTYTVTNAADEARTVIVEHTRNGPCRADFRCQAGRDHGHGLSLPRGRGAAPVRRPARERARQYHPIEVQIGTQYRQWRFSDYDGQILACARGKFAPGDRCPDGAQRSEPQARGERQKQKTLADDEARDRDNLTALKGNDAARRFVDELNQAEDSLQAARKEQADLEKQRDAAQAQLDSIIAKLSFDTDLDVVISN